MKVVKRSLLLLMCVALLVAGALIMTACSGNEECTHSWGDWSETSAATCIAKGTETRTCSECGETETRETATVAHTFSTYTPDGNATCIADGTKTATCTTNGCTAKDTVTDTGSKTAHNFTTYTSNGDATCLADGTKTATCTTDGCSATDTVADAGSKKAHTFATYVSNNDATCLADGTKTATCTTDGCSATETIADPGTKKDHAFTTYIPNNDATCLADGTKTATCDYYGCSETNTVTDVGSKKSHSFTQYVSNGDATCVLDGTKTATCDTAGCNATETLADEDSKLGHLWNADRTCEAGHYCTRDNCDAEEAALGHNYIVVGGTELTCEQDSTTVYACQNGCDDTFTVTNAIAPGHAVSEWKFDHEEFVGECTYVLTYTATCKNPGCGATITKTEEAVRHTLKSSIHTDATCTTPGQKKISCTECDYETFENYTNPDAHVWLAISIEGNVTTYECDGCKITKTVINATTETEATVDKSTLESAGEVELKDASIALDKDTLDGLEGDVSISAGKLEGDDLNTVMGQLGDKLDQIGDNPIYNFGLNDSKGAVSNFDGWITIRVPYTLGEDEDVDSIAVWFINEKGEVESIEAVYDNGYAVFSTNHFSYYTVTRLTPAERCDLYGHSYKETVVNANCTTDGYVLKVCQRCGASSKEITGKATGHDIVTTTVPATCTESGTATHSCQNCEYERVEKIAATGHNWADTEHVDATCQAAGYTVYTCSGCQLTHKTVIAQKAHSYVDAVTKPTCTTEGYTTRMCEWCMYTTTVNKTAALGHDYKTETVANSCTTEGYTLHDCSRCDSSYKTDIVPPAHTWDVAEPTCGKGQICTVCNNSGLPATGEHTMENGKCSVCGIGCTHSYNTVVTAPTCTEGGYTTNTCTICGVVETVNYTAPTGHNWTVTDSKDATCYEAGYINYTCSDCKATNNTVIEQKIHSYTETVTAPTCTADGYTTKVCEYCQDTLTVDPTAALGHDYKTTTVPMTCTEDGYVLHACSRCDDSYKTDVVPAAHIWDIEAPTCGKAQTCTVCNATGLPATGEHTMESGVCTTCGAGCEHTYDTVVTPPTCTEGGYTTKTCTACGIVETTDYTTATGHTWAVSSVEDSTCTAEGRTVYTCSGCQDTYATAIEIKDHSYVETVIAPTCTAAGYTSKVCEWCQHTRTTNPVAALGHDYKTTTIPATCTTDGYTLVECSRCDDSYTTDTVPASHTWDIKTPTCGKGQTCTVCGESGLPATGEHNTVDGVCTVCGNTCTHDYTTVVIEPTCTEDGYTLKTCNLCGAKEKTDYTTAPGHTGTLSCTVCGEDIVPADYYTNILGSLLNEKYTILIDSIMVEDDIYIVDSEVYVSINGGLNGWGTIKIRAYGATATFRAIIEDSVLYLCGEDTVALTQTKNVYAKIPIVELIGSAAEMPPSVLAIFELALSEQTLGWIEDTLLPFLVNLASEGKDEANEIAKVVVNLIADVEIVDDKIVITPSIDKIKALNERLATETVGQFIDTEFGEGTYDGIVEFVDSLFDLTIGEIIDAAKENDADVIALLNSIDALLSSMLGEEVTLSILLELETSFQEMLQSDEVRAITVEEIVMMLMENMGGGNNDVPMEPDYGENEDKPGYGENGSDVVIKPGYGEGNGEIVVRPVEGKAVAAEEDYVENPDEEATPSIRAQLIEMLTMIKDMNLYQMMGADVEVDEAIEIVNQSIDAMLGSIEIAITTDKSGKLLSVDFAYGDYCDLSIVADYTSTVDYSTVKKEAEENTSFTIGTDYLEGTYQYGEYTFEVDENGKLVSVRYTRNNSHSYPYQSGTDDSGNYYEIRIVNQNNSEYYADLTNACIMGHTDCGDWLGISIMAVGTRTYEYKTIIERYENGVLIETIDDPEILEMLGFGVNKEIDVDEAYMVNVEFFVDTKTGELTSFGNSSTVHKYEENSSLFVPAVGCEGVGERHYFCTACGETIMVPYTNGHNYESVYELMPGATSCEEGVIIKYVCTECGKVNNEHTTYGHITSMETLDLSGYDICVHHRFYKTTCPCGQYCDFGYDGYFEWYEGNKYRCPDCGIIISETNTTTPAGGCMVNEIKVVIVQLGDTVLFSETTNRTFERHETAREVTLMPGSVTCEDGIIVRYVCRTCGKTFDEYEEYYHMEYEQVVVNFADYGSTCGGYIYTYACACGQYDRRDIYISSGCEFEHNYEYWNEWCDYLSKYTCAVTDPACGFIYYEHAYVVRTMCGSTYYREYYTLDANGDKIVLYSYIQQEDVYHKYEILDEQKTPTEHPCLWYTIRTEKCLNCGDEREYIGYVFIHNENEHNDGWYCDDCGRGAHYTYDDEGNCLSEIRISWYVYNDGFVEKVTEEYNWIYNKGYSFETLWYVSNESYEVVDGKLSLIKNYFTRRTLIYDFSGTCTVTEIYEENGKGYTDTRCGCMYFFANDIVKATCTQYGTSEQTCVICNTTTTHETSPICHDWYWFWQGECYVCICCGLKNANGASGSIVLEDASDLDDDDDTYIIGYYIRDYGKFEYIYAITLVNEWGDELAFIDLDEFGIVITPWGDGSYIMFSKSAVINAAAALGYTEEEYDIRFSFVPVNWYEDLDYAITFEVMSKTDECKDHFYSHRDGCCVFCGQPEKVGCDHWYVDGWCQHCGERDPYYGECGHWYVDGWCQYCGQQDPNYGESENSVYNGFYDEITEEDGTFYRICYNINLYKNGNAWYSIDIRDEKGEILETLNYYGSWKRESHPEHKIVFLVTVDMDGVVRDFNYVLDENKELKPLCDHYFVNGWCEYCGQCEHPSIDNFYQAPTCTETGYMRNWCTQCGVTVYEEYYTTTEHHYVDGWCEFCGAEEKGDIICEKHKFDASGICIFCGYYKGEVETCKHEDYDMDGWCDMCGESIGFGEECAHEKTYTERQAATCTEYGYVRVICDNCQMIIKDNWTEPYGHKFDEMGNCTNCGYSEGNGDFSEDDNGSEGEYGESTDENGSTVIPGTEVEIPKYEEVVPIG